MQVWKYGLSTEDVTSVAVPQGAQWLDVQVQNGWLCAWALVDPNRPLEEVTLHLVGTGVEFDASGQAYIGTVQVGDFVFHAFALS